MQAHVYMYSLLTACMASTLPIHSWKCVDPTPPHHGFTDGTDFSESSTVHVHCNDGYYLVGSSIMTCEAVPDPFHKRVMWDPPGLRECLPRRQMDDENELSYNIPEQAVSLDDFAPTFGHFGSAPFPDTNVLPGPEGLDEKCTLPKVVGNCRAAFPRYYFNTESMECDMFIYGGCDGNYNNFKTFEECTQSCSSHDVPR